MRRPLAADVSLRDASSPFDDDRLIRGTVALETHGCKLNQSDTEALARQFQEAGYRLVAEGQPADIYVVNSCTVTHVADRKARQALRAARRRNPAATVVATGCYAQRDPTALQKLQSIDFVIGNSDKPSLVKMIAADRIESIGSTESGPSISHLPYSPGRSRAMVKIQEGCNQVCAYCIVPKVRGRERSIPTSDLVAQVRSLESAGYREVVLTGTQLGSYGFDLLGEDLVSLISSLLRETSIPRIRVSSLQAQEITLELLELWQDSRLCPHFHVPLQNGADSVLQRMRRRYTTAMFAEALQRVRHLVSGSSVTTDVIVGFPGETEAEFDEGLVFARDMDFSSMHVFPYSRRPGTGAAHMGEQVDEVAKRERMGAMLKVAEESREEYAQGSLGQVRSVLWERATSRRDFDWRFSGLTDNYLRVTADSPSDLVNQITRARLIQAGPDAIHCRLVDGRSQNR